MLLTEGLEREKIFDILWLHSLKSMAKILETPHSTIRLHL